MIHAAKCHRWPGLVAGLPMLGMGLWLSLSSSVLADESIAISDVRGCRAITVDAERLLCYDTVADGGVFSQQQLIQVKKENFGIKKKSSDIIADRLLVTIVNVQKSTSGIHYFHTEDGNVWKQKSKGSWNLPVPFGAEIKAGALGSFFLIAEGGKSTRVKRVR